MATRGFPVRSPLGSVRRIKKLSTACRMRPCSPLGFCPYLMAVRNPAASLREHSRPRHPRALFLAAFFALGWALPLARAQADLPALTQLADQGDPEAQNTVGNAYANGQGVAQDFSLALKYYTMSADRGYAPAQFNLGMMAELGRGQPSDLKVAFGYYLKAAGQNFAPAQFKCRQYVRQWNRRVVAIICEAVLWFRQAADRGIPEAQYNAWRSPTNWVAGSSCDEPQAQNGTGSPPKRSYVRAR